MQIHRRHIASKLGMAGAELIRAAVLFGAGSSPKAEEPEILPPGNERP